MPDFDPRAVIEGRVPGRPRAGLITGIVVAIGCAIILLGADLLQSVDVRHSVAPFFIALPFALLPVPLLVALVLLADRLEPEPRVNLVFAFAWGAGIAALLATVINTAGLLFITQPDLGKTTGEYISATLGAPVVEESLKGLALIVLLWRRRQELDGPTDGIIYAAMVGIGFAMTENLGYYIDALVRPEVGGVQLLGITFVLRGVLSPFAHPIFTSMTGIGVAYAATHRHGRWAIGAGLLAAMCLHGMWNALTARGLTGLAIAYAILACVFAGLIGVIIADRHRIVRLIWRFLPIYESTGLVTEADLRMLSTLRERRAARRWARSIGGWAAASAMEDYQLAATELALLHLRQERRVIPPDEFEERRRALLRLMAVARSAFFRRQPEPPQPPWAARAHSGFGRHRQGPAWEPGRH